MFKAISEVEGVLSPPTAEVDNSSLNDRSLHLIVGYWTLPEQTQVGRTKTRVAVMIKVACVRPTLKSLNPYQ
ncbi:MULTISPECIES: hypothetical protein [unclassified Microcoleus]|uniref:hypothetical protein n=1 Tax=unclassified Microcoleus TaxID=2642155 RepID=UPI002FD0CA28